MLYMLICKNARIIEYLFLCAVFVCAKVTRWRAATARVYIQTRREKGGTLRRTSGITYMRTVCISVYTTCVRTCAACVSTHLSGIRGTRGTSY